jgi:hypothetical protein
MALITGAVVAGTWIALQTGAVVTLREILKRPELLRQAISWTVSKAKPVWSRLVTNAGKPTKFSGVYAATSTVSRTILAKKAWQEQIYNQLAQNKVKVTKIVRRQVNNAAEKLRKLTDKPSPNDIAAYKKAMNPLNMPSTFDRQLREKYFIATVGAFAADEIIRLWDTVRTEEPIGYELPPGVSLGGSSSIHRPTPTISTSLAEESALERVLDKHLDQPRLLTAPYDVRGPFETVFTDEERAILSRQSQPEYTRGEALRITNQMAANRDPNWKAFWRKQEERGFKSSDEDPNLIEEVGEWLTKDRPESKRVRPRAIRKKGGVVNKRATKQYAKGGSVRTPKRVK